MLEQLQELFNEVAGRTDLTLTPQMRLEQLDLSSLGLIQLICAIEDEFDLEISNTELRSFKTVKNVVDYLDKKLK